MPDSPANSGESSARPSRVLLVEDHADTAAALAWLLSRSGCQVRIAGTAAEAVATASRERFDAVICDLGLPDGNGHDVMTEIRRVQRIPGIALTGSSDELGERGRAAGFVDRLVKPVAFANLRNALGRVLMIRSGEVG